MPQVHLSFTNQTFLICWDRVVGAKRVADDKVNAQVSLPVQLLQELEQHRRVRQSDADLLSLPGLLVVLVLVQHPRHLLHPPGKIIAQKYIRKRARGIRHPLSHQKHRRTSRQRVAIMLHPPIHNNHGTMPGRAANRLCFTDISKIGFRRRRYDPICRPTRRFEGESLFLILVLR